MSDPQEIEVTFLPGGERVTVESGATVAEAAAQASLPLALPCGGKGICGNCRVVIQDGAVAPPTPAELRALTPAQRGQGVRLACQCRLEGNALIQVPPSSRVVGQKDLRQVQLRPVPLEANVKRYRLELPAPSLEDRSAVRSSGEYCSCTTMYLPPAASVSQGFSRQCSLRQTCT